jgi:hypothetical protein
MTNFEFQLAQLFEEMIDPNFVTRIDSFTALEKFRTILESSGVLDKYAHYIDDKTGLILPDPTRVKITELHTGKIIELNGNSEEDIGKLDLISDSRVVHISSQSPTSYINNFNSFLPNIFNFDRSNMVSDSENQPGKIAELSTL